MLPFILTSFHGAVCSLSIDGFLSLTNHLVPFLLAVYCPKKASVLALSSQRTTFAIAACCLCHRSVLALSSQRTVFAITACCAGLCSLILFAFCLFSPAGAGRFYFPLAPFPSCRSLFPFYISVLLPSILFHIGSNSLWFASRRQVFCSCLVMILAFSSQQVV